MKVYNVLIALVLILASTSAYSLEKKTFCIWDPVGRNGPVMSFYSDLIPKAQSWGLSIRFVAYTDEKVAASEFKAGRCEAVLLSAILSRQFVKFGGTMDAIGAITSQKGLELALGTLARPRAGKLMTQGNYEVVATFPVGSMFAFVNDRSIESID
ncbi:putative solute-binding protein, partial [Oleiphilus sp. HI0128]